jgi:hypothetical protein
MTGRQATYPAYGGRLERFCNGHIRCMLSAPDSIVGKVVAGAALFTIVWLIVCIAARIPGAVAGVVEGVVVGVGVLTAYTIMAVQISRERRAREGPK